jgi:hypothetical protein
MDYSYYSYCKKSTGQEFFVPARTLIAVKLLTVIYSQFLLRAFDPDQKYFFLGYLTEMILTVGILGCFYTAQNPILGYLVLIYIRCHPSFYGGLL